MRRERQTERERKKKKKERERGRERKIIYMEKGQVMKRDRKPRLSLTRTA